MLNFLSVHLLRFSLCLVSVESNVWYFYVCVSMHVCKLCCLNGGLALVEICIRAGGGRLETVQAENTPPVTGCGRAALQFLKRDHIFRPLGRVCAGTSKLGQLWTSSQSVTFFEWVESYVCPHPRCPTCETVYSTCLHRCILTLSPKSFIDFIDIGTHKNSALCLSSHNEQEPPVQFCGPKD